MRKPQISVSIDPEFRDILNGIAHYSNTSVSKLVGSILTAQRDHYFQLHEILEKASKLPDDASERVRGRLEAIEQEMVSIEQRATDQLDQLNLEFSNEGDL